VFSTDGVERNEFPVCAKCVVMENYGPRRDNFYEKREMEIGFAVTCWSSRTIFSTHARTCSGAYSMRMCDTFVAAVSITTASHWDGDRAREGAVRRLDG